ncbi:MAG: MCE family protein, partial [Flavobacteriaceae bacterium]|nr:MCE family protein [Flavobacteriaceae bacterium]
ESTLAGFNGILTTIDKGEGSLGKLLKDEGLYDNLEGATKEMEELLREMKLNPKRFVHFSLFGKKPKPYSPQETEEETSSNQ